MSAVEKKPLINISIIGHVDSGKSTLCGRLATVLGAFDERQQAKLSKVAEDNARSSFTLAYYTDRTEQERKRGVTINTTLVEMETDKFRINFLDCPGHSDYIKNATSGCKQSDLSVVVVPGDFQASCAEQGTLKTHLTLAAILGAKNFIVCINKLDEEAARNKSNLETTFQAAVAAVGKMLKRLGVNLDNVFFLPISALQGIGIFDDGKKFDFFEGITPKVAKPGFEKITNLVQAINYQDVPKRPTDKPLRLPISSIAHVPGHGVIICGRVDYGAIKAGDQVKILPLGLTLPVKNVQAHKKDIPVGEAGMNIGFNLAATKATAGLIEKIVAGQMVGPADDAAFQLYPFYTISCVSLKGKAKAGHDEKGIRVGYTPVISCGTSNVASKFVKLISTTGKDAVVIESPDMISKDSKFTALIYPTKQALFESYKVYPTLGKFVCRDSGMLVAVGQILDCVTEEKALQEYNIKLSDVNGTKPVAVAADKKGKKK
ncbi:translation elongation factor EF-1 alpha [Glugoides intestinalis]